MTQSIRLLIRQSFARLGLGGDAEIRETILIRDGEYIGHRFETAEAQAVWLAEEDQIKFCLPDGGVQIVLIPTGFADPQSRAAA
jgi:hypothetical protein